MIHVFNGKVWFSSTSEKHTSANRYVTGLTDYVRKLPEVKAVKKKSA